MEVKGTIQAETFDSGFRLAHDSYHCISAAPDGCIYYVLASENIETGGRLYRFEPPTKTISMLGDLTRLCGEENDFSVPQGKSHDGFYDMQGKLYFSTHVGYYESMNGMEMLPAELPSGHLPYPGGHLLCLDPESGAVEDLLCLPAEGILAMTLDKKRAVAYLLSWPHGNFFSYRITDGSLKDHGSIFEQGEAGEPGKDYRVLCRSLLLDPRDGAVYLSSPDGSIWQYLPGAEGLSRISGTNMKRDYFGQYDDRQPGTMAYNWRKICWNDADQMAYGVHGNSGYLFRFDPQQQKLALLSRISSKPSQLSGQFDQFSYGYLGLQLEPTEQVLYYLCGGPIDVFESGHLSSPAIVKGGARGIENLHLVTYSITDGKYIDHGAVYYANGDRPTYVNSIAIGADGFLYTLARIQRNGKQETDLIRFPKPISKAKANI